MGFSDLPKVTMPVGGKAGTPTLNTLNVGPSHCAHFCVICCPLDHLISKPTTETATIVLNLLECHSKKGREASDKDMVIWALWYFIPGKLSYHAHSKKLDSPGKMTYLAHFEKTQCTQPALLLPRAQRPCAEDRVGVHHSRICPRVSSGSQANTHHCEFHLTAVLWACSILNRNTLLIETKAEDVLQDPGTRPDTDLSSRHTGLPALTADSPGALGTLRRCALISEILTIVTYIQNRKEFLFYCLGLVFCFVF